MVSSNGYLAKPFLATDAIAVSKKAKMSAGGVRRGQKLNQKVQFLGDGALSQPSGNNNLQLIEGEDVADVPLSSPDWQVRTSSAAIFAQDRAKRLQSKLSSPGPPSSRRNSHEGYFGTNSPPIHHQPYESPPLRPLSDHPGLFNIPMVNIEHASCSRPYDIHDETTDDDSDIEEEQTLRPVDAQEGEAVAEARRLVRSITNGMGTLEPRTREIRSGTATPAVDRQLLSREIDYVPAPDEYRPSVLSSILFSKLAQHQQTQAEAAGSATPTKSGNASGTLTPCGKKPKWYDKSPRGSVSSTATLTPGFSGARTPISSTSARPTLGRGRSSGMIATAVEMIKHPMARSSRASSINGHVIDLEYQITDILARRKYILKLCRALMIFGAPTHRMEEYMNTIARKLMVHGSFQYLPNCMIVAFDDPDTHTTEVHLVKEAAAIDLGKFRDTFDVYKNVIHEVYTAGEALTELNEIITRPKTFSNRVLILIYGIAAVSVGPFAFSARPIDFPICFLLGCVLGVLQLEVAPNSTQFSHVFEVLASVITSFAARGFGSITHHGQPIFCFSAIAQSSIALILPGWIILCAAQELQSRNLVAGSIRMVYAIIYTLFLGFGILIGTTLLGLMYPNATATITCDLPPWWDNTSSPRWHVIYTNFAFVPIFTICLAMINQARWTQMAPMTVISLAGYATNCLANLRFSQNTQVANACGAFVVGALANLYSRFFHGLAAAAMLPAIFVQVPSGLAATGSLVAGLTSAEQITTRNMTTGVAVASNTTVAAAAASSSSSASSSSIYGSTIFDVGYGMVQVAIGISVGLFLSALFVYPFNKRRSGLFSF